MRRCLCLLLLFSLPASAAAGSAVSVKEERPAVSRQQGGEVVVSELPDVLADPQVQLHLDSGLTTTFALEARLRGSAVGGARLEIRFEPWDEIFYVASVGIDREVERRVCRSREELRAWWRQLTLPILPAEAVAGRSGPLLLRMDVIPFSESERSDTLRWLSELREGGEREGGERERVAEDSAAFVGQTVQVLLATSIRRRAIKTFRWEGLLAP